MSHSDKDEHLNEKAESSDRNPTNSLDYEAKTYDSHKRLDSKFYEDDQPHMQFMWIADIDGQVQHWLRLGAVPQEPKPGEYDKEFPGLTDKNKGNYVQVTAGTVDGVPYNQILLKMSKEDYKRVKLDPQDRRNKEIQEAMGRKGRAGEATEEARNGDTIATYAPNLPTGGQGFEQIGGRGALEKITSQ